MEPKLIKEEVPDRDTGSSSCSSNSKELSRGARQPTPPAHPEGGGGPASRAPRQKGKICSIGSFIELQLKSIVKRRVEIRKAWYYAMRQTLVTSGLSGVWHVYVLGLGYFVW
jgi:hypothetical protein